MTTPAENLVIAARVVGKALHLIEDGNVARAVRGLAKLRASLLEWSVNAEMKEHDEPEQELDELEELDDLVPVSVDDLEIVTIEDLGEMTVSYQELVGDAQHNVPADEGLAMTHDQFAEALRDLVGEGEDAGLPLPALIAALRVQADTMQECEDE